MASEQPTCPACADPTEQAALGPHHAHVTDYGYLLFDPHHRQDLAGGLIAEGLRQATEGLAYTEADERRAGDAIEDYYRRMGLPPSMRPYAVARIALDAATAGGRRLVGPWEPAEQPEPAREEADRG